MKLPRTRESVEDADWLHLTGDESVRWTGRPSRYTIVVSIVVGVVLALVGVGLTVWLLPVVADASVPRWVGYAPLLLSVAGLARAAFVYLDWLRLLYVVTDDEIYVKYGLVSRDVTHVRLDRVQNTAYDQSVVERILGYGDVDVYTAGTDTYDVTFQNVPDPERVIRLLTERLSERDGPPDEPKAVSSEP